MKSELAALELHYLIKEWQLLIGGKIEKIYQKKGMFLFQFYVSGLGKNILKVKLPSFIFLTRYKGNFDHPPKFCMVLRKYLSGARLREIRQKNFERILEFEFERGDGRRILILELFSKGNLVLCDELYKIIVAYDYQKWSQRTIRGGIKYEYPDSKYNFFQLDKETLTRIIMSSDKESIVKTLAIELSLGGEYAEELLLRAALEKTNKALSEEELDKLFAALLKLRDEKMDTRVYGENDVSPFPLRRYEGIKSKAYESFNIALDEVISDKLTEEDKKVEKKNIEKKESRIEGIIRQQKGQINGFEKAIVVNQKKGEIIYENYKLIEEILTTLHDARKKFSWEEIKERLKNHPVIMDINEHVGTVTLELQE